MSQRILLTGARGFVGGNVIAQSDPTCTIHALSRESASVRRSNLHWHTAELTDAGQLARLFKEARPDAVIHTAAMANIDECEAQPGLADRINVGVTQTLANLCAEHGTRLVFCSTDTVFDGEHAPYAEDAGPLPVNHYARTKAAAEKIVAALGSNGVIARLSLVMGLSVFGRGNSFLAGLIASLRAGREVSVPENEIRTPVDVITLARCLHELAAGDFPGVWHLAGNDSFNRFEMSRRIARQLGLPAEKILATDSSLLKDRAPRPRDVSLSNQRARIELTTPMQDLASGLALAMAGQPQA